MFSILDTVLPPGHHTSVARRAMAHPTGATSPTLPACGTPCAARDGHHAPPRPRRGGVPLGDR